MPEAPQVVIIGGGLGGLCAAHGLRTAGIGMTVHERDPAPGHRPQGYRLHFDSHGAGAAPVPAAPPVRAVHLRASEQAAMARSGPLTRAISRLGRMLR